MFASPPDDLLSEINATLPAMRARTKKFDWRGQALWLKKSVPTKSTRWTEIQRVLAKLIPFPLLKPTTNPGGARGLRIEVSRLDAFRAAGFIAPALLAESDDWIVLSDLGEMVDRKLQKDASLTAADKTSLINRCAAALAAVHLAGSVHGRGKLNDFTLTPAGEIGFIDFEEDIAPSAIPLNDLQARDLWLFSCSAARFGKDAVRDALAAYRAVNDDAALFATLQRFIRVALPLARLLNLGRARLTGDVARAVDATLVLAVKD